MAYNLLKGKRGIIFGALDESSIAWKVALKAHDEGAQFTLSNAPIAMRMGEINNLGEICGAEIVPADATILEDLEILISKSTEILGGKLDFVLHSIGMSPNVRKKKSYGNLNYEWFQKSLDVSALSFHKVMQIGEKLDAFNILYFKPFLLNFIHLLNGILLMTFPLPSSICTIPVSVTLTKYLTFTF